MMQRRLYWISSVLLAISLIALGVVTFWLVYPYKVIEIKGSEFKVENKVVRRGDVIRFTSDYCKYMDIASTITRIFSNGVLFYTNPITSGAKKGCGTATISVKIQDELSPGEYEIQNIYQYKVNPIRVITIRHNTEKFEITE